MGPGEEQGRGAHLSFSFFDVISSCIGLVGPARFIPSHPPTHTNRPEEERGG